VARARGGAVTRQTLEGDLQIFKARFFRALAHPTRIRLLEILVRGGRTVQELQDALTVGQPIVSQQLAILRNQGIVAQHREGSSVRYVVRDPLLGDLLDVARAIFNNQLDTTQGLLRELRRERRSGSHLV
jgi:DNA-binding transcriptional ArsR family regulator